MKERSEGGKGGAGDHMAARGGDTFLSNVIQDKARLQDLRYRRKVIIDLFDILGV